MNISIGSDHAGFKYKSDIVDSLEKLYRIKDYGTFSTDPVDYPDIAHLLVRSVLKKEYSFGILICATGNGIAMTANKYPSIRAAVCWNEKSTALSRQHNDANILCLPARFLSLKEASSLVYIFIHTPFEGNRHLRRIQKIRICCSS